MPDLSILLLDRNQLKDQLFASPQECTVPTTLLLETVVLLIDHKLPWVCKTVSYLLERKAFTLFREIILTGRVCIWFLLFMLSYCFCLLLPTPWDITPHLYLSLTKISVHPYIRGIWYEVMYPLCKDFWKQHKKLQWF